MSLFTPGPRSWRDMSIEYKCMFVYHIVMILMLMAGGALAISLEAGIAAVLVVISVILSLRHRQQVGWHWPGVRPRQLLIALLAIVVGVIFLGSSIPMFSPLQPQAFPWYLAGGGIVTFNILQALGLVTFTEADFISPPSLDVITEANNAQDAVGQPWWHTPLRVLCIALFVAAWLNMAAFTYFSGQAFQHGAHAPTAAQTEPIQNHGTSVYVTSAEKARLDLLEYGQAGIPISIALAAFTHFVLGVKLFSNAPTLAEMRQRAQNPAYAGSAIAGPVRICPSCGLHNIPERQICKRCGTQLGPIDPATL